MRDKIREWCSLYFDLQSVVLTGGAWEIKYDLVFSPELSQRMQQLHRIDYCDPDTSYQEDVMAFYDAATEIYQSLKELT